MYDLFKGLHIEPYRVFWRLFNTLVICLIQIEYISIQTTTITCETVRHRYANIEKFGTAQHRLKLTFDNRIVYCIL